MKISELIKALNDRLLAHGDLECFDSNYFEGPRLEVQTNIGDDPEFNMPPLYLMIGDRN